MGQPIGVIGKDISALGIQAGLASSKVDQLNQAWDQFMQNLTGGTGGLSAFEQSITNMGVVVAHTQENLAQYTGKFSLSTQQFAQSLTSFTGKGAQAWQNFNQVVGSTGEQLIDWLRTAGTEIGPSFAGPFQRGVMDMVGQLVPLASKSKDAQTELLGLAQQGDANIKTFPELVAAVKDGHYSIADLAKVISDATQKMGDMSGVAAQLGTVLNSQVASAISNAALKASGFYTDVNNLTLAMAHNGTYGGHTAAYWANLAGQAFNRAGSQAATAAGHINDMAAAEGRLHNQTVTITTDYVTYGAPPGTPGAYTHRSAQGGTWSGTNSARPGPALVGEQGPELMMFHGGEQVVPARETSHLLAVAAALHSARRYADGTPGAAARAASAFTGAMGTGGGPVVVHMHIAGSVHSEQSLARAVQTAVNKKTLRNGSTQLFIAQRKH